MTPSWLWLVWGGTAKVGYTHVRAGGKYMCTWLIVTNKYLLPSTSNFEVKAKTNEIGIPFHNHDNPSVSIAHHVCTLTTVHWTIKNTICTTQWYTQGQGIRIIISCHSHGPVHIAVIYIHVQDHDNWVKPEILMLILLDIQTLLISIGDKYIDWRKKKFEHTKFCLRSIQYESCLQNADYS